MGRRAPSAPGSPCPRTSSPTAPPADTSASRTSTAYTPASSRSWSLASAPNVDGAGHGDRFDIADLDPDRPGLEGFAIQQSELGVVSRFPWYYFDADTRQRLVTGEHPADPTSDSDLDVGRGSAADLDPGHPGDEYCTSTADVTRPGAGVFSVQDGKVSTTTPSVNFRIWWDDDKGAELLDSTHVDKWDPKVETSTRRFDPAGVVSGARNATPFDGYRLGWTVRGYLQSTYTDCYLGAETRRVPKPALTTAARTEGTS
ncbi:rhamnogalacturonan lyase family protein [Streptomyces mirabilis]